MKNKVQFKKVTVCNQTIEYTLTRKPVKNINMRITPRNGVMISAHPMVSEVVIESFVIAKASFVIKALNLYAEINKNSPQVERYNTDEFASIIAETVEKSYENFKQYGVEFPTIKLRQMSSRWGSCQPFNGKITLNKKLILVEQSCIEYVVVHEFCHFLHPNHSKQFYDCLTLMMPDWKERKKQLARYV